MESIKKIAKKVLLIDRDGTIIIEPPITFQVDTVDQIEFLPGVIRNLHFIKSKLDFEWALVTNQDGLGTDIYPQENFDKVHDRLPRPNIAIRKKSRMTMSHTRVRLCHIFQIA